MLTWKLWQALNRPPVRSPLFRRIYQRHLMAEGLDMPRIPLLGLFRSAGLVILPVILILIGLPLVLPVYYLMLLCAPVLLPLINSVYGLTLIINVSGGIARERRQRTYDLLCTVPSGTLGMHWSYCTGWIHAHVGYRYVMLVVLGTGILAVIVGLSPQIVFGAAPPSLVVLLVRGLALIVFFLADYVQSVIISSLLSLIIPISDEDETNVRLWTASLFVALQFAVYLPTLLLAVYALPSTFQLLRLDPNLGGLLMPVLLVGFFIVMRSLIINGMWRAVEQRLSTTAMELDALTRVTV